MIMIFPVKFSVYKSIGSRQVASNTTTLDQNQILCDLKDEYCNTMNTIMKIYYNNNFCIIDMQISVSITYND